MSDNAPGVLRVAFVAGSDIRLDDWQALLIDRLQDEPNIELAGLIHAEARRGGKPMTRPLRTVLAVERALVRRRIRPYDTRAAQQILQELPDLTDGLETAGLDLAIPLGAQHLAPAQLGAVHYGEWAITFGGARDPVLLGVVSQLLATPFADVEIVTRSANRPDATLLRKALYNPKPGAVLTGGFIAEKAVLLMQHTLSELAKGRLPEQLEDQPSREPDAPGLAGTLAYAATFSKKLFRKLVDAIRIRTGRAHEFWRLGLGAGKVTDFLPRSVSNLPARAHVMADPFLFRHDGELWVFYEAMNADDKAGWIEAARVVGDQVEPAVIALKCPYHLSFPFVFREGDEIYMMPETQQSNRLEIWRATDFPTRWTLHATAFEGQQLAESSLFKAEDGQWWLLTNLSRHHAFQDHSSELYLFSLDGPDLTGLKPHPRNPVVFGADVARNAGAVIRHEGRLFRPSQNNSHGVYGYGLNVMEILRIDATDYKEKLVRKFTPEDRPGSAGLHHLSVSENQFVIDWRGQ